MKKFILIFVGLFAALIVLKVGSDRLKNPRLKTYEFLVDTVMGIDFRVYGVSRKVILQPMKKGYPFKVSVIITNDPDYYEGDTITYFYNTETKEYWVYSKAR